MLFWCMFNIKYVQYCVALCWQTTNTLINMYMIFCITRPSNSYLNSTVTNKINIRHLRPVKLAYLTQLYNTCSRHQHHTTHVKTGNPFRTNRLYGGRGCTLIAQQSDISQIRIIRNTPLTYYVYKTK